MFTQLIQTLIFVLQSHAFFLQVQKFVVQVDDVEFLLLKFVLDYLAHLEEVIDL